MVHVNHYFVFLVNIIATTIKINVKDGGIGLFGK